MNRLNQTTTTTATNRFSTRAEAPKSPIRLRRAADKARAEIKREDDMFRQIIRTPMPKGFFSMLSTAKHLRPLS